MAKFGIFRQIWTWVLRHRSQCSYHDSPISCICLLRENNAQREHKSFINGEIRHFSPDMDMCFATLFAMVTLTFAYSLNNSSIGNHDQKRT